MSGQHGPEQAIALLSKSPRETVSIGTILGTAAAAGQVFALDGDLGSGKTVMALGICRGLGVDEPISSPSFPIMNIYSGRLAVYHFDFYRLDPGADWHELGLSEYLYDDGGVSIIEWPDRIPEFLPDWTIRVRLERLPGAVESARRFTITYPTGTDRPEPPAELHPYAVAGAAVDS